LPTHCWLQAAVIWLNFAMLRDTSSPAPTVAPNVTIYDLDRSTLVVPVTRFVFANWSIERELRGLINLNKANAW
jgi:hypothetical protein